MSTRIATATLRLETENSDFNRKIDETENRSKTLQERFGGMAASAASVAGGFIAAKLTVDAIGAAFDFVKDSVIQVTKAAADYSDNIRDMSVQTGLGTQTLAGLKLMAE